MLRRKRKRRSFSHATLEHHFDTEGMKARRWSFKSLLKKHQTSSFCSSTPQTINWCSFNWNCNICHVFDATILWVVKENVKNPKCHSCPRSPCSLPVSYIDSVSAALSLRAVQTAVQILYKSFFSGLWSTNNSKTFQHKTHNRKCFDTLVTTIRFTRFSTVEIISQLSKVYKWA